MLQLPEEIKLALTRGILIDHGLIYIIAHPVIKKDSEDKTIWLAGRSKRGEECTALLEGFGVEWFYRQKGLIDLPENYKEVLALYSTGFFMIEDIERELNMPEALVWRCLEVNQE